MNLLYFLSIGYVQTASKFFLSKSSKNTKEKHKGSSDATNVIKIILKKSEMDLRVDMVTWSHLCEQGATR